jgi:UDP-N-acetylmuramoyl-L-alanyl-D-glutamate--2,6-diaminopimelate ligase
VRLVDLIAGHDSRIAGDGNVEITGLSYDSRTSEAGDLFFALARNPDQKLKHLDEALNRGARAIVMSGGGWEPRGSAVVVKCERPRHLMGVAASRFYREPSQRLDLVGITGTSGKTSSAFLLASIFEAAGAPAGVIGTIGAFVGNRKIYSGLTTPESLDFEAALVRMLDTGVTRVAAEISSIGLAEGRADALNFRACLFTNLGRDHFDYHGTMENYFAAKQRLFTELLASSKRADPVAVARGDDPIGKRVLESVRCRKISFGLDRTCAVHPLDSSFKLSGTSATLSACGQKIKIKSPLLGEIYLLNILGAVAVSVALGIDGDAVEEGVRRCPGAPGRLEPVPGRAGVTVLVDYAHKPDALSGVLATLREFGPRRIICVFGCGGDRDRGKRPIMGGVAARLSDIPILTSDNPRSEDPLEIIAEVEVGLRAAGLDRIESGDIGAKPGYVVEPDRRTAIVRAITASRPGDIIIIAGKGHEDYQLVGSRKLHFDDREVAREVIARF